MTDDGRPGDDSLVALAARVLVRMGIALLILSLLVRPAIRNDAALWADTVAIGASIAVILTGLIGGWLARRRDTDMPRRSRGRTDPPDDPPGPRPPGRP